MATLKQKKDAAAVMRAAQDNGRFIEATLIDDVSVQMRFRGFGASKIEIRFDPGRKFSSAGTSLDVNTSGRWWAAKAIFDAIGIAGFGA